MDQVLSGRRYWVAQEDTYAETGVYENNNDSEYIRCIRDVLPTDAFLQTNN